MINVQIENCDALQMLCDRLTHWTDDPQAQELYSKMYENYIDGGCFDGCEFDPMAIVDNDWVNYCVIINEGDENFDKIKALFQKNGCSDVSCENVGYSFIESADDDDEPTAFLMRY